MSLQRPNIKAASAKQQVNGQQTQFSHSWILVREMLLEEACPELVTETVCKPVMTCMLVMHVF